MIFTRITNVELPEYAEVGKGFQCRHGGRWRDSPLHRSFCAMKMVGSGSSETSTCIMRGRDACRFTVPPESYHAGTAYLQVEGCCIGKYSCRRPPGLDYRAPSTFCKRGCRSSQRGVEAESGPTEAWVARIENRALGRNRSG